MAVIRIWADEDDNNYYEVEVANEDLKRACALIQGAVNEYNEGILTNPKQYGYCEWDYVEKKLIESGIGYCVLNNNYDAEIYL